LVTLSAFVAYTLAGHTPGPTKAFTSIALFNMFRFSLAMFPMVIGSVIEASACFKRLREFLNANEIKKDVIQ